MTGLGIRYYGIVGLYPLGPIHTIFDVDRLWVLLFRPLCWQEFLYFIGLLDHGAHIQNPIIISINNHVCLMVSKMWTLLLYLHFLLISQKELENIKIQAQPLNKNVKEEEEDISCVLLLSISVVSQRATLSPMNHQAIPVADIRFQVNTWQYSTGQPPTQHTHTHYTPYI